MSIEEWLQRTHHTRDRGETVGQFGVGDRHEREQQAQFFHMNGQVSEVSEDERADEEAMWCWRVTKELRELHLRLRVSQAENRSLREEVAELRGEGQKFQTPEEEEPMRQTGSGKGKSNPSVSQKPNEPTRPSSKTGPTSSGSASAPTSKSSEDQRMEFMLLMMQSMQAMQQRMNEVDKKKGKDGEEEPEKVSTSINEFPPLPEWDALEAPLKMGDWVTLLGLMVADMSDTADRSPHVVSGTSGHVTS